VLLGSALLSTSTDTTGHGSLYTFPAALGGRASTEVGSHSPAWSQIIVGGHGKQTCRISDTLHLKGLIGVL